MGIRGQKPRPHGLKVIRGEADTGAHHEPPAYTGPEASPKCGYTKEGGEPCGLTAGWGTDHKGSGRCRHHDGRDPVLAGELAPPPDLPEELVPAWNAIAPKLAAQRVLTEVDVEAAVQLLFARHFALEAGRTLLAEGTVIAGTKGDRKHPAWQIYRDAQVSLRQWFCEFGMTPSARTRIPSGVDEESSELERLLESRG